jgi:hypothetical protein
MHPPASSSIPQPVRPATSCALSAWLQRGLLLLCMTVLLWGLQRPAVAAPVEVQRLEAVRNVDGVLLNLETRFDLAPSIEDALQKGVALHFVAEAELFRSRWYWRDKSVAMATRTWRLTFQPLTFQYRVSLGGLSQTFSSLREALGVIQHGGVWRIADPVPPDDDSRYYIEFSFKLDTGQLPRPLQIGLGSQPEWHLAIAQVLPLGLPLR